MSLKTAFTDDEWFLLLSTPSMIGASVAAAGQSGLGTVKEAIASLETIAGAAKQYSNNELISELVSRAESREDAKAQASKYTEMAKTKLQGKKPEQLTAEMLEDTRKAVALIQQKAPNALEDYKQWSLAIAEKVANAAKEGGFLGFGGERVSASEKTLIDNIKGALEVA
ncbi:MAG: hypothetical protein ACRCYY_00920 [Trueperaceae bacterium]